MTWERHGKIFSVLYFIKYCYNQFICYSIFVFLHVLDKFNTNNFICHSFQNPRFLAQIIINRKNRKSQSHTSGRLFTIIPRWFAECLLQQQLLKVAVYMVKISSNWLSVSRQYFKFKRLEDCTVIKIILKQTIWQKLYADGNLHYTVTTLMTVCLILPIMS